MIDDKNSRLKDWNKTIAEGEDMRADMLRRAIAMRHGPLRRLTLWLATFTGRWIERGKRWRNDDILGD